MIGVSVRENIGVGDKVQFSSLPENYFRATGERLYDVSRCWIWDYNPYVCREPDRIPSNTVELWNFPQKWEWPKTEESPGIYRSNAEIWASLLGVKTVLNRPRLYRFEHYPFEKREKILFHTQGKSHGAMPDHVILHVLQKYKKTGQLYQIGLESDIDLGIPKIITKTLWDLAEVVSKARMLIGVDSGPAWIASCYPDVVVKKVRLKTVHGQKSLANWVPLERENIHSHWDDRAQQIYNQTEDDVGFTSSYLKL